MQVLFSLLSYNSPSLRRMEQLCRQHDITIVAYAVLGQGLLTDNLTREKFAGNRAAKMTRVKYEELQGLRQEISILAAKYKVTIARPRLTAVGRVAALSRRLIECHTIMRGYLTPQPPTSF